MITENVEVKTYKEKLLCNKCGAEVEATGDLELTSHPPLYLHECTKCGNRISSNTKHPRIYYVEEADNCG